MLPGLEYVKKKARQGTTVGTGNHGTAELCKRFGAELDNLKVPVEMRDVCLIWDEVNLVGQLAFRVIGKTYHWYGIVDDARADVCFKPKLKSPKTLEEKVQGLKATHVLVLQAAILHNVTSYSAEKALRRAVGMYAVANMVAEQADEIVWCVVAHLKLYARVWTRVTTCDGASTFRLMQKINSSGQGRGTSNDFVTSAVPNDVEDDPKAELYMSSDVSHHAKKVVGNAHSSAADNTSRDMLLPDYLVQMVLASHPHPGRQPGPERGETVGWECYIRLFGRLWELLGDSRQPAYWTADPAKDPRLRELKDILRIVQFWHEFNSKAKANEGKTKMQRAAMGLTHQLFYDTHSLIDAWLRLLKSFEQSHTTFSILARRVCQDSLESLFGRMRQACGGQRDLSAKSIAEQLPKQEAKGRRKATRVKSLEQRRNASMGGTDDGDAGTAAGDAGTAAAHAASSVAAPPSWLAEHRITLPADAEAQHAAALIAASTALGPGHHVRWATLRYVQAEDEARLRRGNKKFMRKLTTAKHINRTSYAALKVDLALHILSLEVADQLRLRRHGGWD